MLEQAKFFIEKVNEENRKCWGFARYCTNVLTSPIVLTGALLVIISTGFKHVEDSIDILIRFVFK